MILLLCLLYYQSSWGSFSPISFFFYTYGFKRNANVFLNISNTTSPMVFGFATKEEKKRLKSLSSSNEYCTGNEQLTDIQFFIEHNSSFNFQIPRQMILTPYSIPCTEMYKFHISLNINNGKNHLDYRYQNLQIASIVFFSLYINFEFCYNVTHYNIKND